MNQAASGSGAVEFANEFEPQDAFAMHPVAQQSRAMVQQIHGHYDLTYRRAKLLHAGGRVITFDQACRMLHTTGQGRVF